MFDEDPAALGSLLNFGLRGFLAGDLISKFMLEEDWEES